jgi:membrane-associated phospholipid phosphatase
MKSTFYLIIGLISLCVSLPAQQPTRRDSSQQRSLDLNITAMLNVWDAPGVIQTSHILSNSLIPISFAAPLISGLYGYLAPDRHAAETALLLVSSELLTYGLVFGGKEVFGRERPYKARPDVIIGRDEESSYSFPSGHAAGSAAIMTMLALRYPHWYVITPGIIYALGVACSRMNLGVHHFSDVLVGALTGALVSVLIHSGRQTLEPLYRNMLPVQMAQSRSGIPLNISLKPGFYLAPTGFRVVVRLP